MRSGSSSHACDQSLPLPPPTALPEDSFLSRLSILDQATFESGHRLSSTDRAHLLSITSEEHMTQHALWFSNSPPATSVSIPDNLLRSASPSPINARNLLRLGWDFPDPLLLELVVDGLSNGFSSCFFGPRSPPADQPLSIRDPSSSATIMEHILPYQLDGRISEWHDLPPLDDLFYLPIFLLDKSSGGQRMVVDFSLEINPHVPTASTTWRRFDAMVADFVHHPVSSFAFGWDIKEAFPNLRVRPEDWHLQGIAIPTPDGTRYAVAFCFLLGHCQAGHRFEQTMTILDWILRRQYSIFCLWRWVDDGIHFTGTSLDYARAIAERVRGVLDHLGFPHHKWTEPTNVIIHCGLVWNFSNKTISILPQKLSGYSADLRQLVRSRSWKLRDLRTSLGRFVYIYLLCPVAQPFCLALQRLVYYHRDGQPSRSISPQVAVRRELVWWLRFLSNWSGTTAARIYPSLSDASIRFFVDYSPLFGIGIWSLELHAWCSIKLTKKMTEFCTCSSGIDSSTCGELLGKYFVLSTFGHLCRGSVVACYFDAENVSHTTLKGTCSNPNADVLLQTIASYEAHLDLTFIALSIPREENHMADSLSKNKVHAFLSCPSFFTFCVSPALLSLPICLLALLR
jgi:hypothetical protein